MVLQILLQGNGHLNEVGHKIMADVIMDYLEEVDCK